MIIAIASTNPVKINAVKKVLEPIYKKANFISVDTDSGVSDQPMSDQETKKGAENRSLSALKKTKADLAVGIEGGVLEINQEMYNTAWAAITSKSNTTCFGGGMHFLLPNKIADQIKKGGELGPIMDDLMGDKDIKKKGGAIEIFTQGLTTRTSGYVELVAMAMVKLRRPDLYS